jgi:hypothetical protein
MPKKPPLETQCDSKGVIGSLLWETCMKVTAVNLKLTDIMDLKHEHMP